MVHNDVDNSHPALYRGWLAFAPVDKIIFELIPDRLASSTLTNVSCPLLMKEHGKTHMCMTLGLCSIRPCN